MEKERRMHLRHALQSQQNSDMAWMGEIRSRCVTKGNKHYMCSNRQEKRLRDIWLFCCGSAELELMAGHPQGYFSQ